MSELKETRVSCKTEMECIKGEIEDCKKGLIFSTKSEAENEIKALKDKIDNLERDKKTSDENYTNCEKEIIDLEARREEAEKNFRSLGEEINEEAEEKSKRDIEKDKTKSDKDKTEVFTRIKINEDNLKIIEQKLKEKESI